MGYSGANRWRSASSAGREITMSTGDTTGLLSLGASIVGLLAALSLYLTIVRQPAGTEKMQAIAAEIHLGAMTYLREQYLRIALFVFVVAILLSFQYDVRMSAAFVFGGLTSAAAGFIGMKAATKANVRTTAAAMLTGERAALNVAFNGGAVMGLAVASFGLLGLGILFYLFGSVK
ncbi:MAG TPA: sodium/proton-translocating pyrophosphatase, partial [Rhodospirillales bacterium]|nr:sodium/proton-translocating pyrophosphatase [Rhodospirillales bacterium]